MGFAGTALVRPCPVVHPVVKKELLPLFIATKDDLMMVTHVVPPFYSL